MGEAAKKAAEDAAAKKLAAEAAAKKAVEEAAQKKAADEEAAKKAEARRALEKAWAAADYDGMRKAIALGEAAGIPESEMEHIRKSAEDDAARKAAEEEHRRHEEELKRLHEEEQEALRAAEAADPGSPAQRIASEKADRTKEKRRSSQIQLEAASLKLQELEQQDEF